MQVKEYRGLFGSIHDLSDYYIQNVPKEFWPSFNAAIAHALAERPDASTRLLATCLQGNDDDPTWLKEARADARHLLPIIATEERFRDIVSGRIRETRKLHKLPPLTEIDFMSNRGIP